MKLLRACLALAGPLAATLTAQEAVGPRSPAVRRIEIIAHRGASHDAPENTLAAERLAWHQGADAVETDIQLTKDGQLVVCHDQNTKRTTGSDASVADRTLAELRQLDAGAWKAPQFAGEKLPTLAEQLALLPADKRLVIEIKSGAAAVPELKRVLAGAHTQPAQVLIISFHYDALQAVRAQLPDCRTLFLAGYPKPDPTSAAPPPSIDPLIKAAISAGFSGLSLNHAWPLTAADMKKIKASGLELNVWTVDDPVVARRWIELGADSLTTNRPGWLRAQLGR